MLGGYSPDRYRNRASEQYIITLEFELQRQREKNQILEERITSTQLFIQQMKTIQLQLQEINYKCRAEIEEERKLRINLEHNELRSYAERVAELQHQIKIIECEKENEIQARSKQNIIVKESKKQRIKSASVRESPHFRRKQQNTKRQKNDEEINKLRKFTSQFLAMTSVYLKNQLTDKSQGRKLKIGWKWIKDVVREWDQTTQEIKKMYKFISQVEKLLELPSTGNTQSILETIQMLTQLQNDD